MRVLFVAENYPPHMGGAEVVFQNYAERLAKKGHEVVVLTHRIPGTAKEEVMNGVRVLRIGRNRHLFTFLAPLKGFLLSFDVIHTTTYNGAPAAWLIGLLKRKPVVITVHETWLGQWRKYTTMPVWKTWMYELLERPIWWLRYDKYLPVSESTKRQLEGVLPSKLKSRIQTLHNGFDATQWKSKKADLVRKKLGLKKEFVVFASGRPGPSKGFEYFVKACKKLVPNTQVVLQLSDNKHTHKRREELVRQLPKEVILISKIPYSELPDYMKMADCVVVPSLCEGFGYVVVEANTIGTPVVATATGSIPEVVSGKYVLVKPRSAQAIVEGVKMVKKGKYTKKPLKKWPWQTTKLEKIYEELL